MPRIRDYLGEIETRCRENIERLLGGTLDTEIAIPPLEKEAHTLRALSNPTRLAVILLLRQASLPVCMLSAILGIEQSRLSHHLAVLREAGLIKLRVTGKYRLYSVSNPEAIDRLLEAVRQAVVTSSD